MATDQPYSEPRRRRRSILPILWLLTFVVVLTVVLVKLNSTFDLLHRLPSLRLSSSAGAPHALALPKSGEIKSLSFLNREAVAPFQIKAPAGSSFVVKLDDASSMNPVLTIFVRHGDTVKVHVPLGTYVAKYAFGENWYGEKALFGPGTGYAKAERPLVFQREGNQYTGYSLTLSEPDGGNLKARGIKADEF